MSGAPQQTMIQVLTNKVLHDDDSLEYLDDRITEACQNGDWNKLKRLILEGVSIKGMAWPGLTVLMLVLQKGSCCIDVLELLIETGYELGQKDHKIRSEVMWALIGNCSIDVIEWLVKKGCQLGQRDISQETEFMYACERGCNEKVLSFIIERCGPSCINEVDDRGWTALMSAVMRMYKAHVLQWFVDQAMDPYGLVSNKDIDFQDKFGVNALMLTSYQGQEEYLGILLQAADVNLQNMYGETALHIASGCVQEKDEAMYEWSLQKPSQSITQTSTKKMPHQRGYMSLPVITYLLEAGADPNIRDQLGRTPLLATCDITIEDTKYTSKYTQLIDTLDATKMLHASGASEYISDFNGITPLMAAARSGNTNIVNWFVDELGVDPNGANQHGDTAVISAVSSLQLEVVEKLLSFGVNINHRNSNGTTAMMAACQYENTGIAGSAEYAENNQRLLLVIQAFLQYGADPVLQDTEGKTVLHLAVEKGYDIMLPYLLEGIQNSDLPDVTGNTALHIALQNGKWICAKILTDYAKNINLKNNEGKSPLHDLCCHLLVHHIAQSKEETADMVKYLIEKGANVLSKDASGNNVLFDILKFNNTSMAEILLRHANMLSNTEVMKAVNNLHQSLLHHIVQCASPSTIQWMVEYGVDVNSLDYFQHTPLHLACHQGNNYAVKELIQNGAKLNARDRNGILPIHFAAENPSTLHVIITTAMKIHKDNELIETKNDLFLLLWFAHFFHTTQEVKEVLFRTDIKLPCSLSEFHFSSLPKDVLDNADEYLHSDEWVKHHKEQHPDRINFFQTLFTEYVRNIIPTETIDRMKYFVDTIFSQIKKSHPALPFLCLLSGSVSEGNKVFKSDEFDFIIGKNLPIRYKIVGNDASPYVYIVKENNIETIPDCCPTCKAILSCQKLNREMILSHFYNVCSDAANDPLLWEQHSFIYRLLANDITGANRNISCMVVAIHDSMYPWIKATIDIVPLYWLEETPSFVTIPDFLEHQTCGVVAKWPSDHPLDQNIFRMSFSLCETEMFNCMPKCMAFAYRLAKIIKDDAFFPIIKNQGLSPSDFISSYILKTIITMLFLTIRQLKCDDIKELYDVDEDSDQHMYHTLLWCQAVYRVLCVAIEYGHLEHNYIPGYNLLLTQEKFIQNQGTILMYIKGLCQIVNVEGYEGDDSIDLVEEIVDACITLIKEQSRPTTDR